GGPLADPLASRGLELLDSGHGFDPSWYGTETAALAHGHSRSSEHVWRARASRGVWRARLAFISKPPVLQRSPGKRQPGSRARSSTICRDSSAAAAAEAGLSPPCTTTAFEEKR